MELIDSVGRATLETISRSPCSKWLGLGSQEKPGTMQWSGMGASRAEFFSVTESWR